MNVVSFANYLV